MIFHVDVLECRRIKTLTLQRNREIFASIMFSIKNYSVTPKKFNIFTLNPKKWKKKIAGIFYFGRNFNIFFWKKKKKKFSGYIRQCFKNKKMKVNKKKNFNPFEILFPLFTEAELSVFDSFIYFRNKCLRFLPILIVQENLWACFCTYYDISNQIESQTKFFGLNLQKCCRKTLRFFKDFIFPHKKGKNNFEEGVNWFFMDLIFRKRMKI